ncbi:MAG: type I-C CRISPR-associated protein Cas8c/Csd1 [Gammaproteobacteria bacterium]|jgi:CRISPR-associated protein Csd1
MILQRLNEYYLRRQRSPNPQDRLPAFGLEEKEIPFVIEIDAEGHLVNLADTRTVEGKKKIGQHFLVPQGVKKTSGVAANLLWDSAEYVLGVDIRGKPDRVAEQHAAFRARLEVLPEAALRDHGIRAVLTFLERLDLGQLEILSLWPDILASNPVMTFRLHGDVELVCQRSAVASACVSGIGDSTSKGICLVTGDATSIERLHPAIKGVWGAQTSGANIVSFNLDAFNSYGKIQGANAPLGKPAAFAYTTALNHLLARNSRQRVQIGDTSTVFWAEETHELETALPDLFGEPPKDDPHRGADALKALYAAVQSGKFTVGEADTHFHVLGLAPNAARIAIRFWETATALDLAKRIKCHFDDIQVARAPHDPEHLSLFRLLAALAVQGKADNIPPKLGGEIMRAILEDLPYPVSLLNLAVQRCRAEQRPNYARAACIKAALNRFICRANRTAANPEKEFDPMLDPTRPDPAYRLGRLFAVLEKTQEEASPGLNATIRDRYYGAASSTPVAVFTTLLRLKNHHLAKLSRGRAVQMERLIGQIMDGLADFPRQLALPEQGRFALGYYHQRQVFFAKSAASDEPNLTKEESE